MLRKRLIGVITVKDGWAVQSFGYRRHLPLGRPECLAENLDRWGADEIFVCCIDRSSRQLGPDLSLLRRLGRLGLSTPLIYGGGIRSSEDAVAVVQSGADRISLDALLHDAPEQAPRIAARLGAQALIAALPLSSGNGRLEWHDYRRRTDGPLSESLLALFADGVISEALAVDWRHEGIPGAFEAELIRDFPIPGVPLLAFGGLSDPGQMSRLLALPQVAAVAVGNFLSHREHAVQSFKDRLTELPVRPASYAATF